LISKNKEKKPCIMKYLAEIIVPILSPPILAQIQINGKEAFSNQLLLELLSFGKAIVILVITWLVALIARSIVQNLLKRTNIDNQIGSWLTGRPESSESVRVEKWISGAVYWLIILFGVVAFLNSLNLQAVSVPLNSLLEQVTRFVPQLAAAAILLALAWGLATLTKILLLRALQSLRIDERLNQQVTEIPQSDRFVLSETIANTLYWFIFLLFLPSILSTLNLEGTLQPVQKMLDEILLILPNVFAAALIGAVGWLIAQVVRRVVTNLLAVSGVDRIGTRLGLSPTAGSQSLSWIIGTIVYVLVLIPVAIATLNALKIEAISEPAIEMLNQVLNLLPKLFAASVILILAYIAGKYISELATNILTGVGFNNIFQWLGLSAPRPTVRAEELADILTDTEPPVTAPIRPSRTPSELVGAIVLVAIMLVATLTAVDILEIEALQQLVGGILVIAGQVLVGLIVFAIGLYLANLAFNLIASSGSRQSRFLGQAARVAIIILITAMALQQMGIATNIVNLAFGLLAGGVAVAIALAFGLGCREIAAEQLREWLAFLKNE
jgi:hypothetical protein